MAYQLSASSAASTQNLLSLYASISSSAQNPHFLIHGRLINEKGCLTYQDGPVDLGQGQGSVAETVGAGEAAILDTHVAKVELCDAGEWPGASGLIWHVCIGVALQLFAMPCDAMCLFCKRPLQMCPSHRPFALLHWWPADELAVQPVRWVGALLYRQVGRVS